MQLAETIKAALTFKCQNVILTKSYAECIGACSIVMSTIAQSAFQIVRYFTKQRNDRTALGFQLIAQILTGDFANFGSGSSGEIYSGR